MISFYAANKHGAVKIIIISLPLKSSRTYLDLIILSLQLFQLVFEFELDRPLDWLQMLQLAHLFQDFLKFVYLELDLITELIESAEGVLLGIVLEITCLLATAATARGDILHPREPLEHVFDLPLLAPKLLLVPLEVLHEGLRGGEGRLCVRWSRRCRHQR